MISYLIDAVVLLALLGIAVVLYLNTRELRRLRGYHDHYQFLLEETATAVAAVDGTVREIHDHGAQVLLALGERIADGHKLIGEIDGHLEAAAAALAARPAHDNVLPFAEAAANSPRRGERRPEPRPEPEDDEAGYRPPPRKQAPAQRARPIEKPVKWPTLGERFNQWRDSDATEPRRTSMAKS